MRVSRSISRTPFACLFLVGLTGLGVLTAPAAVAATDLFAPPKSERIIGGTSVPDSTYPFMVSLQRDGSHFCGGTLYAPDVVMTAAHCLTTFDEDTGLPVVDVKGVSVVVGRTVLSDDTKGAERRVSVD